MSWTDFTKDDFSFPGNCRAIVEENDDPLEIGRVRVRIFGIHSLDPEETPLEHLPWAEPCLSVYYSGGQNINNKEAPDKERYLPNSDINNENIPPRNVSEYSPEFVDNTMVNSGSGGKLSVPRKGSQVWCFFENGDHTRIHYWAMAPKARDWIVQKKHLVEMIQEKRDDINELREEFEPDNEEYTGSSCSANAKVKVWTNKPKIEIFQIDKIKNHYITSCTSDLGVTSIIVNEPGKERMYLIHKGYMEYTDENGQRKTLVGTSVDEATSFEQDEAKLGEDLRNDKEELIANNYELHILGDFDIFVNSSTYIQCEKDVQINAKKNIGILSREADIDLICDKADFNLNTNGLVNINANDNIQFNTEKDFIFKIGGDFNVDVGGTIGFNAGSEIINSAGSKFNINSPAGFEVDAGGRFKVDSGAFGANVPMNAPISNALHTGCFPGPGAGPSTPYPSSPSSFSALSFESGNTPKDFIDNEPAIEEDGIDSDIQDLEELLEDEQTQTEEEFTEEDFEEVEVPEPDEEIEMDSENTLEGRITNEVSNIDAVILNNSNGIAMAGGEIIALEQNIELSKKIEKDIEEINEYIELEELVSGENPILPEGVDIDDILEDMEDPREIEKLEYAKIEKLEREDATRRFNSLSLRDIDAMVDNVLNNIDSLLDFLEIDLLNIDLNLDEYFRIPFLEKDYMGQIARDINAFNSKVMGASRAINRSLNNKMNKLERIASRCQLRVNVNLNVKSSIINQVRRNIASTLRAIDSAMNIVPNAQNAIGNTLNSLTNIQCRLKDLKNTEFGVTANFNASLTSEGQKILGLSASIGGAIGKSSSLNPQVNIIASTFNDIAILAEKIAGLVEKSSDGDEKATDELIFASKELNDKIKEAEESSKYINEDEKETIVTDATDNSNEELKNLDFSGVIDENGVIDIVTVEQINEALESIIKDNEDLRNISDTNKESFKSREENLQELKVIIEKLNSGGSDLDFETLNDDIGELINNIANENIERENTIDGSIEDLSESTKEINKLVFGEDGNGGINKNKEISDKKKNSEKEIKKDIEKATINIDDDGLMKVDYGKLDPEKNTEEKDMILPESEDKEKFDKENEDFLKEVGVAIACANIIKQGITDKNTHNLITNREVEVDKEDYIDIRNLEKLNKEIKVEYDENKNIYDNTNNYFDQLVLSEPKNSYQRRIRSVYISNYRYIRELINNFIFICDEDKINSLNDLISSYGIHEKIEEKINHLDEVTLGELDQIDNIINNFKNMPSIEIIKNRFNQIINTLQNRWDNIQQSLNGGQTVTDNFSLQHLYIIKEEIDKFIELIYDYFSENYKITKNHLETVGNLIVESLLEESYIDKLCLTGDTIKMDVIDRKGREVTYIIYNNGEFKLFDKIAIIATGGSEGTFRGKEYFIIDDV